MTITLPIPPKELSPNVRVHWAVKSRHVRAARVLACYTVMQQDNTRPLHERAVYHVKCFFRDARERDSDNLMASLKAYLDGVADAGWIANDSGLWPDRPEFGVDRLHPRIEITFSPETS